MSCRRWYWTGPVGSDPIHSNNLLLDRPVQFYLDRAISNASVSWTVVERCGLSENVLVMLRWLSLRIVWRHCHLCRCLMATIGSKKTFIIICVRMLSHQWWTSSGWCTVTALSGETVFTSAAAASYSGRVCLIKLVSNVRLWICLSVCHKKFLWFQWHLACR